MLKYILLFLFCASVSIAQTNPKLPEPYETKSVANSSKVVAWPEGRLPLAPEGFKVSLLASLDSPRSLFVLPSGDVLVSQAKKTPADKGDESPNQLTLLQMKGSQLVKTSVFAKNLDLPFGMALWKDKFFVAESTKVTVYAYKNKKLRLPGKVIATLPFPKPQRHWTRHLLIRKDGKKLYVSVGSVSNAGESPDPLDARNAAILEMNLDGTDQIVYASGLRNAVSMAWEPETSQLWAVVNERDELGDNLVPDYITSVRKGGFYGWPYSYWGQHLDPRPKPQRLDLVAKAVVPDYSMGSHTASLGITFTHGSALPAGFNHGALIAQHGSWNRSQLVGYKVVYVPFEKGHPLNAEKDFLTGFVADAAKSEVYGRPVATAVLKDGSVLVSDDGNGKIWKVSPLPQ